MLARRRPDGVGFGAIPAALDGGSLVGRGYVRGRSRPRPWTDEPAAGGGYDRQMTSMVTRLRLPTWVQDVLLAVFVAAFQLRGPA